MYKGRCECGTILCLCFKQQEAQTDGNPVSCTSDAYDESYKSADGEVGISCETACEIGSMVTTYRREKNTISAQCPYCKNYVTLYPS